MVTVWQFGHAPRSFHHELWPGTRKPIGDDTYSKLMIDDLMSMTDTQTAVRWCWWYNDDVPVSLMHSRRSVGATVVEMLTGKRPFDELQNEGHIMGEVGRNKLKPTDGRDFRVIELSDEAHCFLDQCFKRYGSYFLTSHSLDTSCSLFALFNLPLLLWITGKHARVMSLSNVLLVRHRYHTQWNQFLRKTSCKPHK